MLSRVVARDEKLISLEGHKRCAFVNEAASGHPITNTISTQE